MECGAVGGRSCGVAKPGKCCSDTEASGSRHSIAASSKKQA